MHALVEAPDKKSWRHQPSFVGVLFANEALLCRMLSFLGSQALCSVCSVARHLHWVIQNMSNSLTSEHLFLTTRFSISSSCCLLLLVPDLQDLVRRATAPYGLHEPMPVAIRSARRVTAVELIENHKLGFQASNGRALWPHFVKLTREVASVIRKHEKDEPDHGARFTLESHLNERLLWLCIYLRLCSDHIFTEWLLKVRKSFLLLPTRPPPMIIVLFCFRRVSLILRSLSAEGPCVFGENGVVFYSRIHLDAFAYCMPKAFSPS